MVIDRIDRWVFSGFTLVPWEVRTEDVPIH